MFKSSPKRFFRAIYRIAALSSVAIAAGCSNPTSGIGAGEKVNSKTSLSNENIPVVVATTSVICDLTQQIAATTVNLKCLVPPGVDPHTYQATSSDRQAIETAKLILYAGYELDSSLAKLVKSSSNPAPKIAVHEVAVPQPLYSDSGHEHEGDRHEEKEEKVAGDTPDPHIWHDAKNGVKMVETIRDKLKQLSPADSNVYTTNTAKVTQELQQIDTWIKSQIQTIPVQQRNLVTTHDALNYYTRAYGLSFAGALDGLSTKQQVGAARVGQLVKQIKSAKVPTIFTEATVNPKLIKTVAKEANIKISDRELFADGLGEANSEGNSYQKMLIANTKTIVEGLGGKYSSFRNQP